MNYYQPPTPPQKPEWDAKTKALVDKHKAQREVVVSEITAGLPPVIPISLEKLQEVLREAFEGGIEAISLDLR